MGKNRDLAAEAALLRQSAQSARANMAVTNAARTRDIAARHDALANRQRTAEGAVETAKDDASAARSSAELMETRDKELLAQSKAARDAGDNDKADELWEEHIRVSTEADLLWERASTRESDAEQHRVEAEAIAELADNVNQELGKLGRDLRAAEAEIDKLEDKARLLQEAHTKATGDDPVAKLDVDDLIERADGIQVDVAKIEAVESDGGWVRPEPEDELPPTPMSLPPDEPSAPKRQAPREPESDRPEVSKEKEVDLDADDAAAVRAEATQARATVHLDHEDKAMLLTKERDEAAREQWSQEQDAKAAQMQVKREQRVVDEKRSTAERLNREADAAADKGDPALADSLRENAQRAASDQRVAEARLESAQSEADRGFEASKAAKAKVEGLEKEYKDLQTQRDQAEKALDGLEERARLLEEAQEKLAEADRSGNETLRKEAEALVERAEHVRVDRTSIETVTPQDKPTSGTPSAPDGSGAAEPTAAELSDVAAKYADAAKALHRQGLEDLETIDPAEKAEVDARWERAGLRAQVQQMDDSKAGRRTDIDTFRRKADEQERRAQQLDRDGKPAEAEEARELASQQAARARAVEADLRGLDERTASLKAKLSQLDAQIDESTKTRTKRTDQLENSADKLDDAARTMSDAHRARLQSEELMKQAEQAGLEGDVDKKLQLEIRAHTAAAESKQLVEKARQMTPDDDAARAAMTAAGVPNVSPPTTPPPAEPQVDTSPPEKTEAGVDGTQTATPESAPQVAVSGDVVGDEETESLAQTTASQEDHASGGVRQEPAAEPGESGVTPPDGGSSDQHALVASAGGSEDNLAGTDGTDHMMETQEADAFDGQESAFGEEQTVSVAPTPAPAQDEFTESVDDGGQVV